MTTQEKRKLTMLLVLPLVIVLFSALGFYVLGGGRGDAEGQLASTVKGINTSLPGAQLKKEGHGDKMSLYELAQRDSASARSHSANGAFAALGWDTAKYNHAGVNAAEENERRIKDRLAEINRQINQPVPVGNPSLGVANGAGGGLAANGNAYQSAELERLQKMLQQKQEAVAPDPQMAQLSGMLDKIMQIQNPALAKVPVTGDKPLAKDSAFKAVPAFIDGNQKVKPGGVVKLKLADTIVIAGITYQKGQSLSGLCTVTNQRLLLDIRNIRLGTSIIPVNLTVFSLDGMAGIAAPEAEIGEAAGQGANGALESMQVLPGDYSIGAQAATAGISAAKSLLGKKVQKIRVKLKGGETVLLRLNH